MRQVLIVLIRLLVVEERGRSRRQKRVGGWMVTFVHEFLES